MKTFGEEMRIDAGSSFRMFSTRTEEDSKYFWVRFLSLNTKNVSLSSSAEWGKMEEFILINIQVIINRSESRFWSLVNGDEYALHVKMYVKPGLSWFSFLSTFSDCWSQIFQRSQLYCFTCTTAWSSHLTLNPAAKSNTHFLQVLFF